MEGACIVRSCLVSRSLSRGKIPGGARPADSSQEAHGLAPRAFCIEMGWRLTPHPPTGAPGPLGALVANG